MIDGLPPSASLARPDQVHAAAHTSTDEPSATNIERDMTSVPILGTTDTATLTRSPRASFQPSHAPQRQTLTSSSSQAADTGPAGGQVTSPQQTPSPMRTQHSRHLSASDVAHRWALLPAALSPPSSGLQSGSSTSEDLGIANLVPLTDGSPPPARAGSPSAAAPPAPSTGFTGSSRSSSRTLSFGAARQGVTRTPASQKLETPMGEEQPVNPPAEPVPPFSHLEDESALASSAVSGHIVAGYQSHMSPPPMAEVEQSAQETNTMQMLPSETVLAMESGSGITSANTDPPGPTSTHPLASGDATSESQSSTRTPSATIEGIDATGAGTVPSSGVSEQSSPNGVVNTALQLAGPQSPALTDNTSASHPHRSTAASAASVQMETSITSADPDPLIARLLVSNSEPHQIKNHQLLEIAQLQTRLRKFEERQPAAAVDPTAGIDLVMRGLDRMQGKIDDMMRSMVALGAQVTALSDRFGPPDLGAATGRAGDHSHSQGEPPRNPALRRLGRSVTRKPLTPVREGDSPVAAGQKRNASFHEDMSASPIPATKRVKSKASSLSRPLSTTADTDGPPAHNTRSRSRSRDAGDLGTRIAPRPRSQSRQIA